MSGSPGSDLNEAGAESTATSGALDSSERDNRAASGLTGLFRGPLVTFVTQVAVVTAVLFYFGWARARATYAYFGLDVSVLDFSASDYVLRSVSTAFPPIAATGFLLVGALFTHEKLRPALAGNDQAFAKNMVWVLGWTGSVLAAIGFFLAVELTGAGGPQPWGPAVMVVGLTVVSYALIARDTFLTRRRSRLLGVVLSLLLLTVLWAVSAYADWVGSRVAEEVQTGLAR